MSLMTHPHVVPSPSDLRSSSEHSLRYFRFCSRAFCSSIESQWTAYCPRPERQYRHHQSSPCDISGSVLSLSSDENTFYAQKVNKNNNFIPLLISFSLGLKLLHVVFLRSASVLYVTRRLTIGRRWSCVMRVTYNTDALRKNTTGTHSRPREKEMNSGIKSLFLFTFCAQKVFSPLDKLKIEPLMSHGLL